MLKELSRNAPSTESESAAVQQVLGKLREWFHCDFDCYSMPAGRCLQRSRSLPLHDRDRFQALIRVVAEKNSPSCLGGEGAVSLWAIPFDLNNGTYVAVSGFVTDLAPARAFDVIQVLGCSDEAAKSWLQSHSTWPHRGLESFLQVTKQNLDATRREVILNEENSGLAGNLAQSYEEMMLFNELSRQLRLDIDPQSLCNTILSSLQSCVRARTLAAIWVRDEETIVVQSGVTLSVEELWIAYQEFRESTKFEPVGIHRSGPSVSWEGCSVAAPMFDKDQPIGMLMALGSNSSGHELGTMEADLLQTVAGVFGGFLGNRRLYTEARELFQDAIRALTSAIDAKDPYTSGHSNRVALFARRLATELGYDAEEVETIYLSGLLHDIGKIGIDENVLRKPGRLTDEEFAHIKLHPELGYRILKNIRRFNPFLPGVRHHHEAWDGTGYPDGLAGDKIPRQAQIIAVADSLDAMTSDRPYRRGMPIEKVEGILRSGQGTQWATDVIDAYFQCRDDLLQIIDEGNKLSQAPLA